MLELKRNVLVFEFPEVHPEAKLEIEFQRTFRIPDDGKTYPLPPGFGVFPAKLVDDCRDRVPAEWVEHGGVMLPMYQAEAMWLNFKPQRVMDRMGSTITGPGCSGYPFAIRVAAGKVNAVNGEEWTKKMKKGDYMVAPPQRWLDGFCVDKEQIRQFVAMPLGWGLTVEQQVTGKEEFGGVQIEVYPMKGDEFEKRFPKRPMLRPGAGRRSVLRGAGGQSLTSYGGEVKTSGAFTMDFCLMDAERGVDETAAVRADMGLGAGGKMKQQIHKDPYGKSAWVKHDVSSRVYVHLANSFAWEAITRYKPPPTPCTAEEYARLGMPWFDHYIEGVPIAEGGKNLKAIKSVLALGFQKGIGVFPNNESVVVPPEKVVRCADGVRNGSW
jgi:hypothetical protein